MPVKPEILDQDAVIDGYGDNIFLGMFDEDHADESLEDHLDEEENDEGEEDDGGGGGEGEVSDEEYQCYGVHWRECPYVDDHPLIMDKIYYDFREEWVDNVVK